MPKRPWRPHNPEVAARNRDENWKPKTFNNYRQTLHRLFSSAVKQYDFVSRDRRYPNPAKGVDKRREDASEIRYLSLEQLTEQLEALGEWPTVCAMVAASVMVNMANPRNAVLLTSTVCSRAVGAL